MVTTFLALTFHLSSLRHEVFFTLFLKPIVSLYSFSPSRDDLVYSRFGEHRSEAGSWLIRTVRHCEEIKIKMGIFSRLFLDVRENDEDDDEEEGECRLNYQNRNNISSSGIRLPRLSVLGGITIYKAAKGLFWKFISIFYHAKPLYSLLPLHNPPTTQPLLAPTISSHPCAFDDNDEDDCVLLCREENRSVQTDRHVAYASTNEEEEDYDDDDRHSSPTIFDGDDQHSVCEDRVLWCQEECYHVAATSDMMHAFVEENEIPFLSKEEKRQKWMKRQKYKEKEKEKEKEEVEVEEQTKKKMKKTKKEKKSVIEVVVEERWIKHYSSHHRILLVGEGNFSFSACLANAFCCAPYIIATSLDSEAFLKKNYKKALSNIKKLRSRGSKVMHEIDATTMANHPILRRRKFDRIVYNFPFAGFFPYLSTESRLRRHRRLVSMFLKNAKEMIGEDGEIHISHKSNAGFLAQFKLESIASSHGLRLIEAVEFERSDYPGYNTKYGFGGDKNFNCVPSNTFKFGLKTEP